MKKLSNNMKKYLTAFLREKPFFFAVVRPKEASLYQPFKPFIGPILDLGCGDGFFASVAFGRLDAGVDPDNNAVKEAKARRIYKEIRYYDGNKIPYENKYFSTVVSNSTLEHISNLDDVLKETSRVLKKNGKFYFTTVTDSWPEYLFGNLFLGDLYKKYFVDKSKHYNMYSISKWKKLLKVHGFSVISYQHYLDNKKILWLFDISHYFSFPSLITKKILGKWVLFPNKEKAAGKLKDFLIKQTKNDNRKGPYLFISAIKIH